jgi:hypothetical protein
MAESFKSHITVDKNIVSLLSKFTYERSFPYALREVVSNSYDADATTARIDIALDRNRVTIHDNGSGMTREEFDYYLRIAGQRRGKRETPKFGRKRIGQFGVGFLAILPFCELLQITSTTENSEEVFTAEIPAWRFFKHDGQSLDVGTVDVPGEVTRNVKSKAEHFTQITLLKLTDLGKRYFNQKPLTKRKNSVLSWPALDRLKWEMQEDLPLAFPVDSPANEVLPYPEPVGMSVYLQSEQLWRNFSGGEIVDKGELTVEGIKLRYAVVTPWKAVQPYELRGLKMRLNNVGVGPREYFDIEIGRKYSRGQWLSGEVQILNGLDGEVTLSRDAFVVTPEYEAVRDKLASVLRKWADFVETVDVASRDMTKQIRGGKQVRVAPKREIVERNIKALEGRGFTVRRLDQRGEAEPVHVDKAKKEVVVYETHPGLEDTISIRGRKRRIIYTHGSGRITYQNACRVTQDGDLEIDPNYPLFKSKRYGDVFKKFYIFAVLARNESSSRKEMFDFMLSHVEKEFRDF